MGFLTTHATDGSLAALLPAIESALLNNASGQKAAVWDWLKNQPDNEATKSLKQQAGARPSRVLNRPTGVRLNDDSPLATQLERDLSMSSGVSRWLYWLEALEKAAPNDFPRLARLAQGNSTAMRFVAARWVEVAPRHFFDTIVAAMRSGRSFPSDELARVLFAEWPKRDPKRPLRP